MPPKRSAISKLAHSAKATKREIPVTTAQIQSNSEILPAEMITRCIIDDRVTLTPTDLDSIGEGGKELAMMINDRAKAALEGRCHVHGYVMPGSVQVANYGVPVAAIGRFTADMISRVRIEADIFNPPENSEIETVVMQHNKAGIYMLIAGVLQLQLPRDYHAIDPTVRHGNKPLPPGATIQEFESVRIGDRIRIRILRTRFQQRATAITGIGELMTIVERGAGGEENPYARATIVPQMPAIAETILASDGAASTENTNDLNADVDVDED